MRRRVFFDRRFVRVERRRSYNWALIYFGSILMTLFIQQRVVSVGIVTDRSMIPTLYDGNTFLINKYIYALSRPRRGDIVVLYPRPFATEQYVKRVVGLSGETLEIRSGRVVVDGRPLEEPYAKGPTYPGWGPKVIPEGFYFVLGDNRPNSEDSRAFGLVSIRNIKGRIKPGELFSLR